MADCLKNGKPYEFYSAGFQVKNTLSDKGAVKRGIFYEDEKCGVRLVESHVERRADGNVYATALNENDWHIVDENTQVSMNMFGFPKSKLMSVLREERARFFAQPQEVLASSKVEWLIPDDVDKAVNRGDATLKVVETPSKWYGITYKEDLEEFIQAIRSMKMAGEYPEHLYENQIEMQFDTNSLRRRRMNSAFGTKHLVILAIKNRKNNNKLSEEKSKEELKKQNIIYS